MGDKPSDNRRRISDNLLDEIEEFDGKDFSEQLLKWKNDSDELSQLIKDTKKSLEQAAKGQTLSDEDNIRNRIQEIRQQDKDSLSRDDIREEINEALQNLHIEKGDIVLR